LGFRVLAWDVRHKITKYDVDGAQRVDRAYRQFRKENRV